jgi:hypothetical protein
MVVMNNLPANKTSAVVLVDNIPPKTTDNQLYHFFIEPAKTVKKINSSTIAGKKPRARLMGYLFAA